MYQHNMCHATMATYVPCVQRPFPPLPAREAYVRLLHVSCDRPRNSSNRFELHYERHTTLPSETNKCERMPTVESTYVPNHPEQTANNLWGKPKDNQCWMDWWGVHTQNKLGPPVLKASKRCFVVAFARLACCRQKQRSQA
ncbi:unnamed protein product [Ectocarpus sp. 6 AP-2014]